MRKTIGVIILFMAAVLCAGGCKEAGAAEVTSIAITKENFPDKRVRKAVEKAFDKNKDKVLSEKEIQGAKELYLGTSFVNWLEGTVDMEGISKLTNLTTLTVSADEIVNASEIQKMPQLTYLSIILRDEMPPLDFSNNINIIELYVYSRDFPVKIQRLPNSDKLQVLTLEICRIKKVTLNALSELKKVSLPWCHLQTLTIKNCPELKRISCTENKKLKKVTVENLPELESLKIGSTEELKELRLPDLPSLESVSIGNAKNLRKITFPYLPELRKLKIGSNAIKKFDFRKISGLREFTVKRNKKITKLDLRPLRKLYEFAWQCGKLKKIQFGQKKNLRHMYVEHNRLGGTWKLSRFPKLSEFECSYNKIKNIYARNHKYLKRVVCEHNSLRKLDLYNIDPPTVFFRGNPHVKAYLHNEVYSDWYYRYDKTAKLYYKEC